MVETLRAIGGNRPDLDMHIREGKLLINDHDVGAISANNDRSIGELLADAVLVPAHVGDEDGIGSGCADVREDPLRQEWHIIGGGVGGCSLLYHLAKLGLTDAVLIEKNELTSPKAIERCPTGAIVWVEGQQFVDSSSELEIKVI